MNHLKSATTPAELVVFILALCFLLAFFGMSWLASLATAQYLAPGEIPQGKFYVAFVPGSDGDAFDSADLRDIGKHKGTFLLPKDRDRASWQGARQGFETYKVLESSGTEQLIEVHHHTADYDWWSQYRATPDKIVPAYSRVAFAGQVVYALPLACLAVYLSWLLIRRGWATGLMVALTAVWCVVMPFVWAYNTREDLSSPIGYWELLSLYIPELAAGAVFLACLPLVFIRPRLAVTGLLLAAVLEPALKYTIGSPTNGWPMTALLMALLSWRLHVQISGRQAGHAGVHD